MWFLALFCVVMTGTLAAANLFPGVLEQIPGEAMILAGGGFAMIALWCVFRRLTGEHRRHRASSAVVVACLVGVPALLGTDTPRRLFFRLFQPELEAMLPDAPPAGDRVTVPVNADLQIYWIDHWGTDRRGGTYFRTAVGRKRSYGFVHKPNAEGSPFGDEDYKTHPLRGDWHSFQASEP